MVNSRSNDPGNNGARTNDSRSNDAQRDNSRHTGLPPNDTRYELRSPSVRELMQRMPRHFVLWGNPLILVIFVAGLLSVKNIRLSQYTSVPAVIQRVSLSGGHIRLAVAVRYDQAPSDPSADTLVLLQLNEASHDGIRCKLLSTGAQGTHERSMAMLSVDTVPAAIRAHLPDSGQVCTIRISTGSKNLFSIVRQHFRL